MATQTRLWWIDPALVAGITSHTPGHWLIALAADLISDPEAQKQVA